MEKYSENLLKIVGCIAYFSLSFHKIRLQFSPSFYIIYNSLCKIFRIGRYDYLLELFFRLQHGANPTEPELAWWWTDVLLDFLCPLLIFRFS